MRQPDPRDSLRGGITAGVEIFASDPDVFRALHSMEKLDADAVGGAIARIEEQRAEGMAWLARRLKKAGELRDGVSAARAAHVLWIAASFDAFDLLHSGRGLPPAQIAEILVDGAERSDLLTLTNRSGNNPRHERSTAASPTAKTRPSRSCWTPTSTR